MLGLKHMTQGACGYQPHILRTFYAAGIVILTALMALSCGGAGNNATAPGALSGGNQVNPHSSPGGRSLTGGPTGADAAPRKVSYPPKGCLYHGVHPGGADGEEDIIITQPDLKELVAYEREAQHAPAFVYFSHEWGFKDDGTGGMKSHAFPLDTVREIARTGRVPFVRLMLRSQSDSAEDKKEKYFTLKNILGEDLNEERRKIHKRIEDDLREWGRVAREEYGGPLVVEWGTEVNNRTFHWNGKHNGRNKKAAELFRRTYRYIARLVSGTEPKLSNITWVFHVTADSDPADSWNHMAAYYPDGTNEDPEDVVDWLGVSVYGVDNLDTGQCEPFDDQLNRGLGEPDGKSKSELLRALAARRGKGKPIFVLEFGTAANYQPGEGRRNPCHPAEWTSRAFDALFTRAEAGVISGFSWWNEKFEGEGKGLLEMRVEEFKNLPGGADLLREYRSKLDDVHVVHVTASGGRCSPRE